MFCFSSIPSRIGFHFILFRLLWFRFVSFRFVSCTVRCGNHMHCIPYCKVMYCIFVCWRCHSVCICCGFCLLLNYVSLAISIRMARMLNAFLSEKCEQRSQADNKRAIQNRFILLLSFDHSLSLSKHAAIAFTIMAVNIIPKIYIHFTMFSAQS